MENLEIEPGSFRDRNGRIFYKQNAVFRTLSDLALKEWETLSNKAFFKELNDQEKLIPTELVTFEKDFVPTDFILENNYLLKHEKIPFISYPYEWSFGMLKDVALLQLELMASALNEDMILKDSSAYNFQWKGTHPVFIDIPSFERLRKNEPWIGYKQFCQMFLYPLFVQAYKDIPFQSWLRGNIDGIDAEHLNNMMSIRDIFRPGVFTNVFLHSKFQIKYNQSNKNVKKQLNEIGFYKELISSNVKKLHKIISKLGLKSMKSEWSDYADTHSYSESDFIEKQEFVEGIIKGKNKWEMVWDLGCNTGTFSKIASQNADYTIAMDADHMAIERLYLDLKKSRNKTILPLTISINNPSPNHGWRGLERKDLPSRGKPDLILCLALIHHMVISANIPLNEFIAWLASLRSSLIIEFVTKEDQMVKTLLLNKEDNYIDYEINFFEKCLEHSFTVIDKRRLDSGTRFLYYAKCQ